MERTGLVVDVVDLLEHPGEREPLRFEHPAPEMHNDLVRVSEDPLAFDLTLEVIDEGAVWVQGDVSGRYEASCRRCLETYEVSFTERVGEVYRPRTAVWEEGYVVLDETVDLEPLVRDAVLLDLPMYPLCREDCLGLCTRCGGNRNRGECACPEEPAENRWSALRDLLPRTEA